MVGCERPTPYSVSLLWRHERGDGSVISTVIPHPHIKKIPVTPWNVGWSAEDSWGICFYDTSQFILPLETLQLSFFPRCSNYFFPFSSHNFHSIFSLQKKRASFILKSNDQILILVIHVSLSKAGCCLSHEVTRNVSSHSCRVWKCNFFLPCPHLWSPSLSCRPCEHWLD